MKPSGVIAIARDHADKVALHRAIGTANKPSVEDRLDLVEKELAWLTGRARWFSFAPKPTVQDEVNRIKVLVALRAEIHLKMLEGTCRDANIIWPRHVVLYLLRQTTALSLAAIGAHFRPAKPMDHASVSNALYRVKERMERELPARLFVKGLVEELKKEKA